jgi:hypothetical protein
MIDLMARRRALERETGPLVIEEPTLPDLTTEQIHPARYLVGRMNRLVRGLRRDGELSELLQHGCAPPSDAAARVELIQGAMRDAWNRDSTRRLQRRVAAVVAAVEA